jgi:hypothetical protein
MRFQTIEVKGHPVKLERRRYSNKTFTWAYLILGDESVEANWKQLGDPWPCINPPKRQLEAAVDAVLACDHNEMIERPNDAEHAWQCAKCGHVYSSEGGGK